jgi:hypothetical protein
MKRMRIVPVSPVHLGAAASLLTLRQARLRAVEASLPGAFNDREYARLALAEWLAVAGWHGAAAFAPDRLVGFRVVYLRFRREIDPRIAWADGHVSDPGGGQA